MTENSQRCCSTTRIDHGANDRCRRCGKTLLAKLLGSGLLGLLLCSGPVACDRAGTDVAQRSSDGVDEVKPVAPRRLKPRAETPADDDQQQTQETAPPAIKQAAATQEPADAAVSQEKPEPTVEKPAAEKPAAEKPAAEKPAVEKPAVEKPAVEKPAVEKPAAEKPAAEKPAAEKPAAEKPVVEKNKKPARKPRPLGAPDEPIREPQVALSDYHKATSVLQIGDRLPEFKLADLTGRSWEGRELLGQPLSVIVFWNEAAPSSREQFLRLSAEVWDRFTDAQVSTMAIHVGATTSAVTELITKTDAPFPVLLDPDQSFYSRVAKSRFPRTLLVNQAGEVLWMDLEYSRSTRRDLVNAIYFHLSKRRVAADK